MVKRRRSGSIHNKIQVLNETCFPVREAKLRLNTKPQPSTLLRWARDGLIGANDQRIFLDTCLEGGKVFTSHEAYRRFISALVGGKEPEEEGEESI